MSDYHPRTTDPQSPIRAFVAVLISADLKRKIAEVQKDLKKAAPSVKWVEEENFHITMKFLGDVPSEQIDEVRKALEEAVVGVEPFDIEIGGVGAFPNPMRPRVVWAGNTSGHDALAAAAECIETSLEQLGFIREDRRFRSHITLGRVREGHGVGRLPEALEKAKVVPLGVQHIESVALMKSELRREGPVYSVLAEIKFRG